MELLLSGANVTVLKEAGHQMSTNLVKCKNQWQQELGCQTLITKEEWNIELGNTLTLGADALAAQRISSLQFEVDVEQHEYDISQADASIRLFVNSKDDYSLPGHNDYKIHHGSRVSLLLRKVAHISRTSCRDDSFTITYYPGSYSSHICLKDVDQRHIINACDCFYKISKVNTTLSTVAFVYNVFEMLSASADRKECLMHCEQDEWDVTMTFLKASRNHNSSMAMTTIAFHTISSIVYTEQLPVPKIAEIAGLLGIHSGTSFVSVIDILVFIVLAILGLRKSR